MDAQSVDPHGDARLPVSKLWNWRDGVGRRQSLGTLYSRVKLWESESIPARPSFQVFKEIVDGPTQDAEFPMRLQAHRNAQYRQVGRGAD